jgi:hypothetical protein
MIICCPGLKVSLLLLEITLIADLLSVEVRFFGFLDFFEVPSQQLVSIFASSEAHLLLH